MFYNVSYANNLTRVSAKVTDGSTTPRQFIADNGVSLGNYRLQLNGIALQDNEYDKTFDEIVSTYGINPDLTLQLAGIKPANGGCK